MSQFCLYPTNSLPINVEPKLIMYIKMDCCVICFENKVQFCKLLPCNHENFCINCILQCLYNVFINESDESKMIFACPYCRTRVTEIQITSTATNRVYTLDAHNIEMLILAMDFIFNHRETIFKNITNDEDAFTICANIFNRVSTHLVNCSRNMSSEQIQQLQNINGYLNSHFVAIMYIFSSPNVQASFHKHIGRYIDALKERLSTFY